MWRQFQILLRKNIWVQQGNLQDFKIEVAFVFVMSLFVLGFNLGMVNKYPSTEQNLDPTCSFVYDNNTCNNTYNIAESKQNPLLITDPEAFQPFYSYNFILCTVIPIIFANPCRFILYQVSKEREINIIETLRIHNLSGLAYGASFIVIQSFLSIITSLFITLACSPLIQDPESRLQAYFKFFAVSLLLSLSLLVLSLCVSIPFKDPKMSSQLGLLALFLPTIVLMMMDVYTHQPCAQDYDTLLGLYYGFSWIPQIPALLLMKKYLNANFSTNQTWWFKQVENERAFFGILATDIILYSFLYLYLHQVFINDLPFWWPLRLCLKRCKRCRGYKNLRSTSFFSSSNNLSPKHGTFSRKQIDAKYNNIGLNDQFIDQDEEIRSIDNQPINLSAENEQQQIVNFEQIENMVEARNICKQFYEQKIAFKNIEFNIKKGFIACLIGENGAGKTTLIKILAGLVEPDASPLKPQIIIDGKDMLEKPWKARQNIKLCHQFDYLFQELSPRQHFTLACEMRNLKDGVEQEVQKKLEDLELDQSNIADTKVSQLSNGMKRRVSIGMALLGKSKLIILDEPTANLSQDQAEKLWNIIAKLQDQDILRERSILVTTQDLKDLERDRSYLNEVNLDNNENQENKGQRFSTSSFQNRETLEKVKRGIQQAESLGDRRKIVQQVLLLNQGQIKSYNSVERFREDNQYKKILVIKDLRLTGEFHQLLVDHFKYRIRRQKYLQNYLIYMIHNSEEENFEKFLEEVLKNFPNAFNAQNPQKDLTERIFITHMQKIEDIFLGHTMLPNEVEKVVGTVMGQIEPDQNANTSLKTQELIKEINPFNLMERPQYDKKSRCREIGYIFRLRWALFKKQYKIWVFLAFLFIPRIIIILAAQNPYIPTKQKPTPLIQTYQNQNFESFLQSSFKSNKDNENKVLKILPAHVEGIKQQIEFNGSLFTYYYNYLAEQLIGNMNDTDKPFCDLSYPEKKLEDNISYGLFSFYLRVSREVVPVKLQAIVFCLCSGIFLYNQVEDMEQKRRFIYRNAGFSRLSYYIGYFIFDCLMVVIPTATLIIPLLVYQKTFYCYDYQNKILTLIVFGITVIPMLYITGFFFKNRDNAFRNAGIFLFLFGFFIAEFLNAWSGNQYYNILTDSCQNNKTSTGKDFTYESWQFLLFMDPFIYNLWSLGFPDNPDIYHGLAIQGVEYFQIYYGIAQFGFAILLLFFVILLDKIRCSSLNKSMLSEKKFNRQFSTSNFLSTIPSQRFTQIQNDQNAIIINGTNLLTQASDQNNNNNPVVSLQATQLLKYYTKGKNCVNIEDIKFYEGRIHGIYGSNGSGKSTLLRLLCKMSRRSYGEIKYDQVSITDSNSTGFERQIGMSPEDYVIWEHLDVDQHFNFIAQLKGLNKGTIKIQKDQLIKDLGLTLHQQKSAGTLSGGNKRKLQIALALLGNPRFIFLDETFQFLDPLSKENLKDYLKNISRTAKNKPTIVLISQNDLEFQKFCDYFYHLDQGKLISEDTNLNRSFVVSTVFHSVNGGNNNAADVQPLIMINQNNNDNNRRSNNNADNQNFGQYYREHANQNNIEEDDDSD